MGMNMPGKGRDHRLMSEINVTPFVDVMLVLLIVFMVQNTERVGVSFLLWDLTWPVWLLVLGAALLGAIVLYGLGVVRRHRQRNE